MDKGDNKMKIKLTKATIYGDEFLTLLKSTDEEAVNTAKCIMRHNLIQDIHKCFKKWSMQFMLTDKLADELMHEINLSVDAYLNKVS